MDKAAITSGTYLDTLENRIKKEYKQAEKEIEQKMKKYLQSYEKNEQIMKEKYRNHEIKHRELREWRNKQYVLTKKWESMKESMAQTLAHSSEVAEKLMWNNAIDVYALNYNYGTYLAETTARINTSFALYDHATVSRLMIKNPKLIPSPSANVSRKIKEQNLKKWSKRKMQSVMTQAVLQGESMPKIAKRLAREVGGMSARQAVRTAQTMTTSAMGGGRLDAFKRAERLGIQMEKEWVSTPDARTRASHRAMNGEKVPVNEEFSNGLMFPADPDGKDGREIYNCRCTMIGAMAGLDNPTGEVDPSLGGMGFEEWEEMHTAPKHTNNMKDYEHLKGLAQSHGIKHNPVKRIKPMNHDETVAKIAGGDMTHGSCVSVALAYCSNRKGLDVLDFRGGDSQQLFSMLYRDPFRIANANISTYKVRREASEVANILATEMELDKEYCLVAGSHASIVRNSSENGLEFLELQSKYSGYKPFKTERRTVEDTLRSRFLCKKNARTWTAYGEKHYYEETVHLIDVESMEMTEEFQDIMGYINTEESKQRKGRAGHAK